MEDKRLEVSQLIKQARIDKGLSQRDLATKLNVGESVVHHYEKGKQNMTVDTLQKIAETIGAKITIEFG